MMSPVSRGQQIYYSAVGLFALWVGVWGYLLPLKVDHALPWLVPPLHARFLGAVYFSAAILLFGGLLCRFYAEVRAMVPIITIWTGQLLVVSLFHLDQFDFGHRPVWFWFFAYVLYPLIGLSLIWRHRGLDETVAGPALPSWARTYFQVQGAVLALLALALLVAPTLLATLWPWKISPLLVQIYSAPFLAYAVGSGILARQRTWPEVRLVVVGLFSFTVLVLVASFLHRGLFAPTRLATWVWFGGFLTVTCVLGGMIARFPRRAISA